ncbi:MAG TPA: uracil-DNA glycosylase [Candidatus Tripitaka californicus]|uniref:uracil-DNA glycosylase n=2 Tax=Candidatus Tripitaka californicus TaxID=3367616 RepID=UPI0040293447
MNPQEELLKFTKEIKQRLLLEKSFGIDFLPKQPPKATPEHQHHQPPVEVKESLETYAVTRKPGGETTPEKVDDRVERLAELGEVASTCTKCRLSQSRTRVVFGVGNPFADLMFVGEGPGYDEDQQGEPFVGRAGQLLTKIIEAMKLTRQVVYIANMVKCRPPENRTPRPDEMLICSETYLKWQIAWIRPKVICTLGNCATQGLLQTREPIGSLRGRFLDYPPETDIKLMPTFHPAYLLRNPNDKPKCWEDMKKIMKELGIAHKDK